MEIKAVGVYSGERYRWKDGKFDVSERAEEVMDRVKKKIKAYKYFPEVAGTYLPYDNPEDYPLGAFWLMNEVEPVKLTGGNFNLNDFVKPVEKKENVVY